jgi:hypothetical protein
MTSPNRRSASALCDASGPKIWKSLIHVFPAFEDDIRSLILAAFVVVESDALDQAGNLLSK